MRELNENETKILQGLILGLRCKEIAYHLFMSEDSVITVCFRMRDRFGVKSNNALVAFAIGKGFVENPYQEQRS